MDPLHPTLRRQLARLGVDPEAAPTDPELWRALLPVSHYAELQLGQASLGLVGQAAWQPVLALLGFVPLWLLVAGLQGRRSHG